MNTLELAYKAGISDYYKQGKKYGKKAYPPSWMNATEKKQYLSGKKYAITQEY